MKSSGVSLNGTDSLKACIDIYLRDPDRDAIDKKVLHSMMHQMEHIRREFRYT